MFAAIWREKNAPHWLFVAITHFPVPVQKPHKYFRRDIFPIQGFQKGYKLWRIWSDIEGVGVNIDIITRGCFKFSNGNQR
jgi:hypothetical protein